MIRIRIIYVLLIVLIPYKPFGVCVLIPYKPFGVCVLIPYKPLEVLLSKRA